MPVVNLNNEELQQLLAQEPDIQLLDVRTPQEYWLLGHIPEARLLPIHMLPDALPTLNPSLKTVLVCEHGVRSIDASYYLLQQGFHQVYNLTAGMAEWNGPRVFASLSDEGGQASA
ncbi:MAG TPA: rhodanese-like domain-containing protein [Oculatellaceae cyanobacterium]|jgi:rhodanese-related sulfurtransferase